MNFKKITKGILLIIISAVSIFSFASCGGESVAADVPISDFTDKFASILTNSDKLSAVDDSYLSGMLDINASDVDDYILMVQAMGTAIDQYGVFKVTDASKRASVKTSVQSYIDTTKANWANFNYLPEETVKIDNATVVERGNYILFTIMSESEKTQIVDAFNNLLK
ncbi:MAG: DUF4358 domain-containing protein [Eubacteriales bacterium]